MNLFKSYITKLVDVRNMMSYSCTMSGRTIILGTSNKAKLNTAKEHVQKAIEILLTFE